MDMKWIGWEDVNGIFMAYEKYQYSQEKLRSLELGGHSIFE